MDENELSDFEFNEMRIDLLNALVDIELGRFNMALIVSVTSRIDYLNNIIDKLPPVKSLSDYWSIDMCQQFYRIRDLLKSLKVDQTNQG